MFKVRLYMPSGEVKEYETPILQYAKRYADLYKDTCSFVEIIFFGEAGESLIETFGRR